MVDVLTPRSAAKKGRGEAAGRANIPLVRHLPEPKALAAASGSLTASNCLFWSADGQLAMLSEQAVHIFRVVALFGEDAAAWEARKPQPFLRGMSHSIGSTATPSTLACILLLPFSPPLPDTDVLYSLAPQDSPRPHQPPSQTSPRMLGPRSISSQDDPASAGNTRKTAPRSQSADHTPCTRYHHHHRSRRRSACADHASPQAGNRFAGSTASDSPSDQTDSESSSCDGPVTGTGKRSRTGLRTRAASARRGTRRRQAPTRVSSDRTSESSSSTSLDGATPSRRSVPRRAAPPTTPSGRRYQRPHTEPPSTAGPEMSKGPACAAWFFEGARNSPPPPDSRVTVAGALLEQLRMAFRDNNRFCSFAWLAPLPSVATGMKSMFVCSTAAGDAYLYRTPSAASKSFACAVGLNASLVFNFTGAVREVLRWHREGISTVAGLGAPQRSRASGPGTRRGALRAARSGPRFYSGEVSVDSTDGLAAQGDGAVVSRYIVFNLLPNERETASSKRQLWRASETRENQVSSVAGTVVERCGLPSIPTLSVEASCAGRPRVGVQSLQSRLQRFTGDLHLSCCLPVVASAPCIFPPRNGLPWMNGPAGWGLGTLVAVCYYDVATIWFVERPWWPASSLEPADCRTRDTSLVFSVGAVALVPCCGQREDPEWRTVRRHQPNAIAPEYSGQDHQHTIAACCFSPFAPAALRDPCSSDPCGSGACAACPSVPRTANRFCLYLGTHCGKLFIYSLVLVHRQRPYAGLGASAAHSEDVESSLCARCRSVPRDAATMTERGLSCVCATSVEREFSLVLDSVHACEHTQERTAIAAHADLFPLTAVSQIQSTAPFWLSSCGTGAAWLCAATAGPRLVAMLGFFLPYQDHDGLRAAVSATTSTPRMLHCTVATALAPESCVAGYHLNEETLIRAIGGIWLEGDVALSPAQLEGGGPDASEVDSVSRQQVKNKPRSGGNLLARIPYIDTAGRLYVAHCFAFLRPEAAPLGDHLIRRCDSTELEPPTVAPQDEPVTLQPSGSFVLGGNAENSSQYLQWVQRIGLQLTLEAAACWSVPAGRGGGAGVVDSLVDPLNLYLLSNDVDGGTPGALTVGRPTGSSALDEIAAAAAMLAQWTPRAANSVARPALRDFPLMLTGTSAVPEPAMRATVFAKLARLGPRPPMRGFVAAPGLGSWIPYSLAAFAVQDLGSSKTGLAFTGTSHIVLSGCQLEAPRGVAAALLNALNVSALVPLADTLEGALQRPLSRAVNPTRSEIREASSCCSMDCTQMPPFVVLVQYILGYYIPGKLGMCRLDWSLVQFSLRGFDNALQPDVLALEDNGAWSGCGRSLSNAANKYYAPRSSEEIGEHGASVPSTLRTLLTPPPTSPVGASCGAGVKPETPETTLHAVAAPAAPDRPSKAAYRQNLMVAVCRNICNGASSLPANCYSCCRNLVARLSPTEFPLPDAAAALAGAPAALELKVDVLEHFGAVLCALLVRVMLRVPHVSGTSSLSRGIDTTALALKRIRGAWATLSAPHVVDDDTRASLSIVAWAARQLTRSLYTILLLVESAAERAPVEEQLHSHALRDSGIFSPPLGVESTGGLMGAFPSAAAQDAGEPQDGGATSPQVLTPHRDSLTPDAAPSCYLVPELDDTQLAWELKRTILGCVLQGPSDSLSQFSRLRSCWPQMQRLEPLGMLCALCGQPGTAVPPYRVTKCPLEHEIPLCALSLDQLANSEMRDDSKGRRQVFACKLCGHFWSRHMPDLTESLGSLLRESDDTVALAAAADQQWCAFARILNESTLASDCPFCFGVVHQVDCF